MYPNYNHKPSTYYNNGDRFFFAAPFLFGALAGGAVASTTRPRPVYVNPPMQPQPYYNPGGAYGQASYSYFYPTYK